jgi:hypothetical protein
VSLRIASGTTQRRRRAGRLVWLFATGALLALVVAAESGSGIGSDTSVLGTAASAAQLGGLAAFVLSGALIVSRQPANLIGWLLMVPGLALPLSAVGSSWLAGMQPPPAQADPVLWLALWVTSWSWVLLIFPIFHLLLVFPSGRLLSPRWRWVVALEAGMVATMLVLAAITSELTVLVNDMPVWSVPNPIGFMDPAFWSGAFATAWSAGLVIMTAASVTAFVLRFRRGTTVERQQLKWPLLAVTFFGVTYAIGAIQQGLANSVATLLFGLSLAAIPVSVAIAVLRYRLYEIDRIISRTLGWLAVTLVLAGVFAAGVIGLQALLEPVTGNNTVAVAASTLLAASLFQPLRRRIQRAVDRRFNRARADAAVVGAAFANRLREEIDLETLGADFRGTVDGSLAPSSIGLWFRTGVRG